MARRPQPQKMTPDEIANLVKQQFDDSEIFTEKIQEERERALNYYLQEPYGNELPGQSQVRTSEVRDTIEYTLPEIMDIFSSATNAVSFKPIGKDDQQQAEIETLAVKNEFYNRNDGDMIVYYWAKDALLQKNGIVRCYYDERVLTEREEYSNLTITDLQQLQADDKVDIREITLRIGDEELAYPETEEELAALVQAGQPIAVDVVLYRDVDASKVCVENVAPEDFYVDRLHSGISLDDASFVGQISRVTASDLRNEGYSQDVIDELPSGDDVDFNDERVNRFEDEGGVLYDSDYNETGSRRVITILEAYIRADYNGDGVSELRYVKTDANGTRILENEEVDSIPYVAFCPYPIPHKYYGLSQADLVADLQLLKSELWRQTLNNLYLTNEPRIIASKRGNVEIDQLNSSQPGGVIWADDVDSAKHMVVQFTGDATYKMFDIIDSMRSERTGLSPTNQGLDSTALSDSTNMVGAMIMNAAQKRVKMVARMFSYAMRELFLKIHELLYKYRKTAISLEYDGQFIQVDPRSWRKRKDTTLNIASGYTDKVQKIASLQRILDLQQTIFQAQGGPEGPLLNLQNVYNTLEDLTQATDLGDVQRYFANPAEYRPKPPQPSPVDQQIDVQKAALQAQTQKDATELQLKKQKQEQELEMQLAEMQQQQEQKTAELKLKREIELAKLKLEESIAKAELAYKYDKDVFPEDN